MRRFTKMSPRIWRNPQLKSLTPVDLLVYLYLHFSGHTSRTGIVECPPGYVTNDLPVTREEFQAAIVNLKKVGLIEWDPHLDFAFICDWYVFNGPMNDKHYTGILDALEDCPSSVVMSASRAAAGEAEFHRQEKIVAERNRKAARSTTKRDYSHLTKTPRMRRGH